MTARVVLTRANEKQITDDWQREIPSLGVYKRRWLMRRVEPLLVGVCLDRDSGGDTYKPCFHVHCLGRVFSTVALTLCTELRSERSGAPSCVEVKWHAQKYKDAAAWMIRQSRLPLEGDLRLGQVLGAYRDHLRTPLGQGQAPLLYRDMIVLSAWSGDSAGAGILLSECLQLGEHTAFRHVGGPAGLETECRRLIDDPRLIQQTVDSQIEALGVGHLPVSSLLR